MKNSTILFILLIYNFSFAQLKGDMTLIWSVKSPIVIGDQKIITPQFNPVNFQFDSYTKQVYFTFQIPISNEIDEKSIQITNIVYEEITSADIGDLDASVLPIKPNAIAKNLKSREDLFASILLSPILKEGSAFKKIKSFSYTLSTSNNRLSSVNNEFNTISNSVLTSGDWYRFYVVKSGVYKLSRSFLSGLGINVDIIDPRKIKIYGNGGRMIPLKNSTYYPADLNENAIQVVGENDGDFNNADYILFYAEGVDQWNAESQTTNNLYDSKSYYYINVQGNDGKRIPDIQQPSAASDFQITTFDDSQYYEVDNVNIVRLGRRWFGEQFDFTDQQSFQFKIPNIVASTTVNLYIFRSGDPPDER